MCTRIDKDVLRERKGDFGGGINGRCQIMGDALCYVDWISSVGRGECRIYLNQQVSCLEQKLVVLINLTRWSTSANASANHPGRTFSRNAMFSPQALELQNDFNRAAVAGSLRTA